MTIRYIHRYILAYYIPFIHATDPITISIVIVQTVKNKMAAQFSNNIYVRRMYYCINTIVQKLKIVDSIACVATSPISFYYR